MSDPKPPRPANVSEKMYESLPFFQMPQGQNFDRVQLISRIDALANEADEFLEEWRKGLALPALVQPDLELSNTDPVWDYTKATKGDFLRWYRDDIAPLRQESDLDSVCVHTTYIVNLFDSPDVPLAHKGIVKTGRMKGQFGYLEEYDKDFDQFGWRSDAGPGSSQRMSHDVWILIDREQARQQARGEQAHKLKDLSIVFVDPRTYRWYLGEVRQQIERSEEIVAHTAMRLDQLQQYLTQHKGRFPFERDDTVL